MVGPSLILVFQAASLSMLQHLRSIKICYSISMTGHSSPRGLLLHLLKTASVSNVIEVIDYEVINYHQSPLNWYPICDGIDATLSQPQFRNLQRFTLLINEIFPDQFDWATKNLPPLYAGQLAALDARGIFHLEVRSSTGSAMTWESSCRGMGG